MSKETSDVDPNGSCIDKQGRFTFPPNSDTMAVKTIDKFPHGGFNVITERPPFFRNLMNVPITGIVKQAALRIEEDRRDEAGRFQIVQSKSSSGQHVEVYLFKEFPIRPPKAMFQNECAHHGVHRRIGTASLFRIKRGKQRFINLIENERVKLPLRRPHEFCLLVLW